MESVDAILQRHLITLHAFVRARAGPAVAARESISDLVQSVCREVLEQQDRFEFRGEAAFKSWLYTTALRKIIERNRHHRAQKRGFGRQVRATADDGEDRALLEQYATFSTPSMHLAAREQVAAIDEALAQLSEQHREVITLAKIAGLPHDEIGKVMGISEEASRQLLRRALMRLTGILGKGSA